MSEGRDLRVGVGAFTDALRIIGVAEPPIVMIESLEDWAILARAASSYSHDEFQIEGIVFRRQRKAPVPEFYK